MATVPTVPITRATWPDSKLLAAVLDSYPDIPKANNVLFQSTSESVPEHNVWRKVNDNIN